MVGEVEVFPYYTLRLVVKNVIEMGLESIHQSVLGLSYILNTKTFACYAVYNIGALACDVVFSHILSTRGRACYPACFVQPRAVAARLGCLWIARFPSPRCGSVLREFGSDQEIPKAFWPLVGCKESILKDPSCRAGAA